MAAFLGLAVLWCLWGALHSLLIWPPLQRRLEAWLGPWRRWYRLGYNLLAAVTLLLPLGVERLLHRRLPLELPLWSVLRWPLLTMGLLLLYLGARQYPLRTFLGLEPGVADVPLVTTGVLRWVRHPWYTATLCLLWARVASGATLVTAVVLSLYVVVGAHLEERKLLAHFGEDYRRYRRQVPMLLPRRPRS